MFRTPPATARTSRRRRPAVPTPAAQHRPPPPARRVDLILKPRDVPHAFWSGADEPARLLEIITPGGFEGYFERLGGLPAGDGPPDLAPVAAAAGEHPQ